MIVRIFDSGTSNGESPVRYLLSDTDHTGQTRSEKPEVLWGSPDITIAAINSIQRKHKYISGAIAFRDNEHPSREGCMKIIQAFKETVCPGLDSRHYNSLFVLHQDKGNIEIHFLFPNLEMTTGRRLNIHPPGPRNIALYDAFTKVMNHELGYEQVIPDPLKLALSDFERRTQDGKRDRNNKLHLHKHLSKAIMTGQIRNRDELCHCLEDEFGLTIPRKGDDYISVKFPGAQKAKRLRGPLYHANADYGKLLEQYRNPPPATLSAAEYQHHKTRLAILTNERRQFFAKAYLQPRQLRARRQATLGQKFRPTETGNNKPIHHKETKPMPTQLATMKQIIADSLATAQQLRAERTPPTINKMNALRRMKQIRQQASSKTDLREHADMDAIQDIQNALGEIESDIHAATADMNHAKNPEQRRKAEERLAKLVAQKNRLLQQLEQAKIRQINRPARNI
jgi:hypothetical protein